ncbi:MAG TPA: FtsX-like permease family protein, partial [Candidatus Eisenbacteria bacterium]
GTLKAKGGGPGLGNADEQILVPFNTGRFRLFGNDRLNDIMALASADSTVPDAMAEIQSALRHAHRIPQGRPDDFTIRNQSDFLTTVGETTAVFTLLLAGIAAVSPLVGGIGIMNIMLVSVTERTREIGIRRALGARRHDILLQFLAEASFLSLAGGVFGVTIGVTTARVITNLARWPTQVQPQVVLLALGFASLVGVFFGWYPARRAAYLDVIESLRYE